MHFKDFTDQFYQYPHQLSYSQLLRSHHASFESFNNKTFLNNLGQNKAIGTVHRSNNRRFNGKVLKNIFTQLKNKTSSELETFIDLNALNVTTEYEPSSFSVLNGPMPHESNFQTTYKVSVSKGDALSKSIQVVDKADHERIKEDKSHEITVINPEIQISTNSQEMEHVEKSIKFMVYDKNQSLKNKSGEKEQNYIDSQTSVLIKNKNAYSEGKVIEVYNVLKKAISNVKGKYKKCRPHRQNPTQTGQTSVDAPGSSSNKSTIPRESVSATDNSLNPCKCDPGKCDPDKCGKCGKLKLHKLQNGGCTCWTTEEETLFCLLKIEARENFKQIKQIEQELKLQRKALKVLNHKCTSLENVIKKREVENRGIVKSDSERSFQEIFVKPPDSANKKEVKDTVNKLKLEGSRRCVQKNDMSTHTHSNPDITIYRSEIVSNHRKTEDLKREPKEVPNSKTNELPSPKTASLTKFESDETSKSKSTLDDASKSQFDKASKCKRDEGPKLRIDSVPISKSIVGSKVKITISRSTVVINTSSDEVFNLQKTELSSGSNKLSTVQNSGLALNAGDVCQHKGSCDCIPLPRHQSDNCTCPPKKSSFVIKLFRKKKCDDDCKCCTTTITNKKQCKYYLMNKNKCKYKG